MLEPLFEDHDVKVLVDLHRDAVAEHNCCKEGVKETSWVVEMYQGIQSYTHREHSISCKFSSGTRTECSNTGIGSPGM